MQIELKPHPSFPSRSVTDVYVDVRRASPGLLDLWYVVQGDLDRIVIPPPGEAKRADNLWQTTCFELFLRSAERSGYFEFNFSSSGEWAAYSFAEYRQGMKEVGLSSPPIVSTTITPWDALEAHVTLPLDLPARTGPCFLNLAAIVEAKGDGRSFWAHAHPPGEPDFHHPACFTLELPPPAQA